MYFNSTHAHLRQKVLYLYPLVYNLPDDGLVEAATYRRDTINDKWLFITDFASCWIKYYIILHKLQFSRTCLYSTLLKLCMLIGSYPPPPFFRCCFRRRLSSYIRVTKVICEKQYIYNACLTKGTKCTTFTTTERRFNSVLS